MTTIAIADFRSAALTALAEIFAGPAQFILDPGESLIETLSGLTAGDASRPLLSDLAPICAQVNHIVFLIDTQLSGNPDAEVDWSESWQLTTVDPASWAALIIRLAEQYETIRRFIETNNVWNASYLTGALTLLAHCAYHLGQIREALGILRAQAD